MPRSRRWTSIAWSQRSSAEFRNINFPRCEKMPIGFGRKPFFCMAFNNPGDASQDIENSILEPALIEDLIADRLLSDRRKKA
jgi:hypothetical protein